MSTVPRSTLRTALLAGGLIWPLLALPADPPALPARPAVMKPHKPPAGSPSVPDKLAASQLATAPPTAATDPIEHLRQRLSARLSASKTSDAAPNDLRVTLRTGPTGGAAAGPATGAASRESRGPQAGGRRAVHAKGAGDDTAGHWDYKGSGGPAAWSQLKSEFALCGSGERQSPIDIRGGLSVDLDPVRFDYKASRFGVVDNGRTVQVNLAGGNAIEVGGKRYELVQFHFHRPSEERIDGRQFEMSLHLVHKDDQGRLAVVGLLFDQGPAHPVLQKVWNNLPLERGEEAAARVPLELDELLPADRRYYTYMGSLTTPPCSEGVLWVVMRQPVTLTPEQIDIFARIYPMNARPVQQALGRRILQSN